MPPYQYSPSGRALKAPTGLFPAARATGMEPEFLLWAIVRDLAGPHQTWVEFSELQKRASRLFSQRRTAALIKKGHGIWWQTKPGRDGKLLVMHVGISKMAAYLRTLTDVPIRGTWTMIPYDDLQGVQRRRGAMLEALIGETPRLSGEVRARPRSRQSIATETGISPASQARYRKVARSRYIKNQEIIGPAPKGINYLNEPGVFVANGQLYRRLPNSYVSRYTRHRGRHLEGAQALAGARVPLRYCLTPSAGIRQSHRGFTALVRQGRRLIPLANRAKQPAQVWVSMAVEAPAPRSHTGRPE